MNSSTGISESFVKWALVALMVNPLITLTMWFATATQLNSVQDQMDVLQARQQQTPQVCTSRTEQAWVFFNSRTESCIGDK